MKDSKEYSARLSKLFKSLKKTGEKQPMPVYSDPIEAVVYALLSEYVPESAASKTYKRIKTHFVDLNDLRVSRVEEIMDFLRDSSVEGEKSARAVKQVLNTIFDKTDRISLDNLGHEGKRQAHKELSEIEGITPFAVNYCFLTALGGHAVPLTDRMQQYLKKHQIVHPEASIEDISGFLERQISASDAWEFYFLLRNAVEGGSEVSVEEAPKKKSTVKKAAAKNSKSPKPEKKAKSGKK